MNTTQNLSRRKLLKSALAGSIMLPFTEALANKSSHTLLLIELQGGNDGLNTVIPYTEPLYYELRPNIAIQQTEQIPISSKFALHNALKPIMPLWQSNQMAVVLGLGYPHPNRSHFRSIEIWDTASKSDEYLEDGWLKTLLTDTASPISNRTANGLILGGQPGPLLGTPNILEIKNLKQFSSQTSRLNNSITESTITENHALKKLIQTQNVLDRASLKIKERLKPLKTEKDFGNHPFAKQMAIATQAIQSRLNIPVIKTSLKSFDTHNNQINTHKRLLNILAESIATTQQALSLTDDWNNVTIMTYSEFGRRAQENGTKGTDHGTAAPHFILGGNVQGGIYGKQPSLADLENDDLKYTADFSTLFDFAKNQIKS